MSRIQIQETSRWLKQQIDQGERPRTLIPELRRRFSALPEVNDRTVTDLVRKTIDGLIINQVVAMAEEYKDQLPDYGLGQFPAKPAPFRLLNEVLLEDGDPDGIDFNKFRPTDLVPVDFKLTHSPFDHLKIALDDTVSAQTNLFFDKPTTNTWHALISEYRRLFHVECYVENGALKSNITGGVATAARTMTGALRALPLLAPDRSPQEYLEGARLSGPTVLGMAMVPLQVMIHYESLAGAKNSDSLPEKAFTLDLNAELPILRVNRALLERARLLGSAGVHTGCPAHISFDGQDDPIQRLWTWCIDVAEKAQFFEQSF